MQLSVLALIQLPQVAAVTSILNNESMERSRWIVFNLDLEPLEQAVILANPQDAERIAHELANRFRSLSPLPVQGTGTALQIMNPTVPVGMPRQGSDRLSPYRGGRPRPEAPVACKSGRLTVSLLDMARTP